MMRYAWLALATIGLLWFAFEITAAEQQALTPDRADTLARLTRDFRMHVYETFRLDRAELERRRAAWGRVEADWKAAGRPLDQFDRLTDWLRAATRASSPESRAPLPEPPRFGRRPERPPLVERSAAAPVDETPMPALAPSATGHTVVERTWAPHALGRPAVIAEPLPALAGVQITEPPAVIRQPAPRLAEQPALEAARVSRTFEPIDTSAEPEPAIETPKPLVTPLAAVPAVEARGLSPDLPNRRQPAANSQPVAASLPIIGQRAIIGHTEPELDERSELEVGRTPMAFEPLDASVEQDSTVPNRAKPPAAEIAGPAQVAANRFNFGALPKWSKPATRTAASPNPVVSPNPSPLSLTAMPVSPRIAPPELNEQLAPKLGKISADGPALDGLAEMDSEPAEPRVKPPPTAWRPKLNLDELAARTAGHNLALAALEAELDKQRTWRAAEIEPLVARLRRLATRTADLDLYHELIPAKDRWRVGQLESAKRLIAQMASRIVEARALASSDQFPGSPAERTTELERLDRLSRELAELATGR